MWNRNNQLTTETSGSKILFIFAAGAIMTATITDSLQLKTFASLCITSTSAIAMHMTLFSGKRLRANRISKACHWCRNFWGMKKIAGTCFDLIARIKMLQHSIASTNSIKSIFYCQNHSEHISRVSLWSINIRNSNAHWTSDINRGISLKKNLMQNFKKCSKISLFLVAAHIGTISYLIIKN